MSYEGPSGGEPKKLLAGVDPDNSYDLARRAAGLYHSTPELTSDNLRELAAAIEPRATNTHHLLAYADICTDMALAAEAPAEGRAAWLKRATDHLRGVMLRPPAEFPDAYQALPYVAGLRLAHLPFLERHIEGGVPTEADRAAVYYGLIDASLRIFTSHDEITTDHEAVNNTLASRLMQTGGELLSLRYGLKGGNPPIFTWLSTQRLLEPLNPAIGPSWQYAVSATDVVSPDAIRVAFTNNRRNTSAPKTDQVIRIRNLSIISGTRYLKHEDPMSIIVYLADQEAAAWPATSYATEWLDLYESRYLQKVDEALTHRQATEVAAASEA